MYIEQDEFIPVLSNNLREPQEALTNLTTLTN